MIDNIGVAILKVSFKGKSKKRQVQPSRSPQDAQQKCQELGIMTANVDEVNTNLSTGNRPKNIPQKRNGCAAWSAFKVNRPGRICRLLR